MMKRNLRMVEQIEQASVRYPFSFAIAGDSGAWPDPTVEAIFTQLVRQVDGLEPRPVFFANLGDFAGPGTRDRHEAYLRHVESLDLPNICVLGNHDVDDETGLRAFADIHGPTNFDFAYGNTRFFVMRSVPGQAGSVEIPTDGPDAGRGPDEEDLAVLASALSRTDEPIRIVLMHMPPSLGGHYAPHPDWGFTLHEREFLDLLRLHHVDLVCAAHGLAFDTVVNGGTRFVMSGGGGSGLCSHFRGICTEGDGRPEQRGAVFHATQISITEEGELSGRVIQAFAGDDAPPVFSF